MDSGIAGLCLSASRTESARAFTSASMTSDHPQAPTSRLFHTRTPNMAVDAVFNQRRRRRRRRRQDKPAISARLFPDDRLKGETGVLSDDLFQDLFPAATHTFGMPN